MKKMKVDVTNMNPGEIKYEKPRRQILKCKETFPITTMKGLNFYLLSMEEAHNMEPTAFNVLENIQ